MARLQAQMQLPQHQRGAAAFPAFRPKDLLKGSWDLATGVIIRITILITPIKVFITLLTKSRDPPSSK